MIIKTEGGHTFKVEDVLCLVHVPGGQDYGAIMRNSAAWGVPLTEAEYEQILRVMQEGQVTYPAAATVAEAAGEPSDIDKIIAGGAYDALLSYAQKASGWQLSSVRAIIDRMVLSLAAASKASAEAHLRINHLQETIIRLLEKRL